MFKGVAALTLIPAITPIPQARQRGAVHQRPATGRAAEVAVWANVPRATLKRLVSGTPKRVSTCAAWRGEHMGM